MDEADVQDASAREWGTIRGVVTTAGGEAVGGYAVSAVPDSPRPLPLMGNITNGEGRFGIPLPAGGYVIRVRHPDSAGVFFESAHVLLAKAEEAFVTITVA
ncbi:carboxypeptidase-like regulatory domain-containing protein [Streptomyces sp. NPDC021020]|uniref:carboxypeptidase-like regulatory domain-containing protein n=1 Tax=Streptomyces sp. NPDC021020 TaxID=3365109 RepID=UPI0037B3849A